MSPEIDRAAYAEVVQAHDRTQVKDAAAYARSFHVPIVERLLARVGDGRGSRVLIQGRLSSAVLREFADWVGEDGVVHLGPGRTDPAPTAAAADRAQIRVVTEEEVGEGGYDVVYAHRALYHKSMASPQAQKAAIQRLRRLTRPGGTLMMYEMDFTGWLYLPSAPAVEELRELIERTMQHQFSGARLLPGLFRDVGLDAVLEASTSALPADSWIGVKPLSRGRGLAASGAWEDRPDLDELLARAEAEIVDPDRVVITPTSIYAMAVVPVGK